MAESQSSRLLFESPLVRAYDVMCGAPRSGFGETMLNEVVQIGLPRRGVFLVHRRGVTEAVDANTALILGPRDEYRVAHPTPVGDEGTVFALPLELLEDAMGCVEGRVGTLHPREHLAVRVFDRALRDPGRDELEAEDATLLLLGSLSGAFQDPGREDRSIGPGQRLRVERARALLAATPTRRWNLRALGRALQCSPFHLTRQFHVATGETISRYALRLRLAVALERLADGERDLAALAIQTGFTHHSHFSARFRSVFGMTPSKARDTLARRTLADLRAILAGLETAGSP